VPKTLLAVDDSATMRKVLEITFSGEDFRVVTANGKDDALGKLGEEPSVAVVDTVLDGQDGYALAKELRSRDPKLTIVLLSSRYHPYDANRGREAGADDYMDKPFDTQQMIDKVRRAMVSRESQAGKPSVKEMGPTSTAPSMQSPFVTAPRPAAPVVSPAPPPVQAAPPAPPPPPPPPVAPPPAPRIATAVAPQRTHTLSFEGAPPAPAPPLPTKTVPTGMVAPPIEPPKPAPAAGPTAVPPVPTQLPASVNGQLAGKIGELGLTPQQAEAVLALSRDVVEKVVWEVVPQLAEALIKEEIARLMKER
jgi:CheY-like chemotaxis protein